ncbi:MAG: hypothetical protein ACOVK6_06415 [Ramlibacter sp.]|jgi:hypothetical protein
MRAATANTTCAINTRQSDLQQACRALWRMTLTLMNSYLRTRGPAQRVMLARRIARNFQTLERESAQFAPGSREAFARLARRWAQLARWT